MAPINERNKYIMVDNPALRMAAQETNGDTNDLLNRIANLEKISAQAEKKLQTYID
jgi:hypothetical protein